MGMKPSRRGRNTTAEGAPSRLSNTTCCLPIVYGSIAFFLGNNSSTKKSNASRQEPQEHTHRWTLYVRGPNNEDLSVAIDRVIFHLHPSFPKAVREINEPPFEVTEMGWGEFEATLRIVWQGCAQERATVLTHFLRLYPAIGKPARDPVVHEFYDEVVFTDPTESFYERLSGDVSPNTVHSKEPSVQERAQPYSDDEDYRNLLEVQKFLDQRIEDAKRRILCSREAAAIRKDGADLSVLGSSANVSSDAIKKGSNYTAKRS